MKRVLVVAVLLCILIVALIWWRLGPASPEEGDALVVYGNVDIRQVELAFRVGGRIAVQHVDEGDRVKEGQLLAELDPGPIASELGRADAEVAAQEAALAKMLAGYRTQEIAQAEAAYEGSRIALDSSTKTLERLATLRGQQAVSQQMLDDARSQHAAAMAAFQADSEQLRLMREGYRAEDIAAQQAMVDAAYAAATSAAISLEDTMLHAPQAGTVLTRVREAGAIVQPGQTVYTLTLTDPTWVRGFITQPQLGLVKPGQQVWLEIDAFPGTRYKGTVGFISPQAEFTPKTVETREVRNDLVFRFRVLAEDPDNVMRQGMPVTITIPMDQNRGAAGAKISGSMSSGTSSEQTSSGQTSSGQTSSGPAGD